MTGLEQHHLAIVAALARHGVQFVLVGGAACQVQGWTGTTKDVDVTVAVDPANTTLADAALGELCARNPAIGALGTSFGTPLGRVELLRETDGVGGFEAWRLRAQLVQLADGVRVLVGHPDDLLRSKESANRDKDLAQLPGIRRDFIAAGVLDAALARGPVAEQGPARAAHLVAVLGPRPAGDVASRVWDRTAATIERHRARYAIEDAGLGPAPPAGSSQAADRRQVERAVERARRIIERTDRQAQPPGA